MTFIQFLRRLFSQGASTRFQKPHFLQQDASTNPEGNPTVNIHPPRFEPINPTLEDIPVEMVLAIAKYLDPATRGALALASRALFLKLGGNSAVKLDDPSQRHELLLLLARDKRYLPLTLCSFCHIFHRPIQSSAMTSNPEASSELQKCQRESPVLNQTDYSAMAEYLPPPVHQSIVNAVMESYAHDAPTLRLRLGTDSHEIASGTATISLHYSLAIVKNHILLKTEKIILPCRGNNAEEVLAAVDRLGPILESSEHSQLLNNICEHRKYLRVWHRTLFGIFDRPRFNCIWTHPLDCRCCSVFFEKRPCISRCKYCYTDTGIDIRDLSNGGGRALAVTTWRDLGSRNPNSRWKSHSDSISPSADWRKYNDAPTVLLDFEGEDASLDVQGKTQYVNFKVRSLPYSEGEGGILTVRGKDNIWISAYHCGSGIELWLRCVSWGLIRP